jgi:hypothetical protein
MSVIIHQEDCPRWKTTNRCRSVDAKFQFVAVRVSLSLLPIRATNTVIIYNNDYFTFHLSDLHDQYWLTLHWCSFSEWPRNCVTFSIAYKCSLYLIYEHRHPIATQITQNARPKIIDWLLSPIFNMGQGVCLTNFWFERQPIHQKRTKTYIPMSIFCDSQ